MKGHFIHLESALPRTLMIKLHQLFPTVVPSNYSYFGKNDLRIEIKIVFV